MAVAQDLRLLIERVNLRTILLSIVAALGGVAAMYASALAESWHHPNRAAMLREAGAALLVTFALAALWDLAGKRAFTDEVLAKANMSRDLADAGIEVVTDSFKNERINWGQLFKNSCRLDIFVSYGATWRNTQLERLDALLADEDGRLRVLLPDPEDEHVMTSLALRFQMNTAELKKEIEQAREFFEYRQKKAKGKVEIYFSRFVPLFSFYRFNNKAVFALYNHRLGRLPVPSFVCDEDGFLFQYFNDEFEGMLADEERTRRVDPAKPSANEGNQAPTGA